MSGSDYAVENMPPRALMAVLVLSLVTTVTGIRQFGSCRIEFWRDRDAGVSVDSYYWSTNTMFLVYDHVARALIFSALCTYDTLLAAPWPSSVF